MLKYAIYMMHAGSLLAKKSMLFNSAPGSVWPVKVMTLALPLLVICASNTPARCQSLTYTRIVEDTSTLRDELFIRRLGTLPGIARGHQFSAEDCVVLLERLQEPFYYAAMTDKPLSTSANPSLPNSAWDTLVQAFKGNWIGAVILAVAAIIGFALKAFGLFDQIFTKFFAVPDLVISPLSATGRLMQLPGHPIITLANSECVFTGGFRARISVAHNQRGTQPIKITGVRVKIVSFVNQPTDDYRYIINFDELIGRQIAEVQVFSVSLAGDDSIQAFWVDANGTAFAAQSDNLLDVTPPRALVVAAGTDLGEELDITTVASEPGLYKIYFSFEYFVAGKDYTKRSELVQFYYEE